MAELTADGDIIVTAFTQQDIPVFVRDEVNSILIDSLDNPDSSDTA